MLTIISGETVLFHTGDRAWPLLCDVTMPTFYYNVVTKYPCVCYGITKTIIFYVYVCVNATCMVFLGA